MVRAWESEQIGFATLIGVEITCARYFADKILGDSR